MSQRIYASSFVVRVVLVNIRTAECLRTALTHTDPLSGGNELANALTGLAAWTVSSLNLHRQAEKERSLAQKKGLASTSQSLT